MMGGLMMNTVAISCAIVVVLYAWKVVNVVWLRPRKLEKLLNQQGLKGNKYRFLYGDINEMFTRMHEARSKPISMEDNGGVVPRVAPLQHHALQKYGKNFVIWWGWTPKVNIMDPELVKEVFTNINDFQKPRSNPQFKLLIPGLVSYDGDQWVKHRKLLTLAFRMEKLKNMLPAFHLSCVKTVEKWNKMVSEKGSCELDVWPDLQALTSDVISRTAFGSSYEEGMQIFQLIREQAQLLLSTLKLVNIPGMWYLPTRTNRRMRAIEKEVQRLLRSIIGQRTKEIKSGEGNCDDLLGLMLESNMKAVEEHGNKSHGMTIDEVVEECKLFYFAGQETSASTLLWTMVLLSKHQEWQSRAREEVFSVFGNENLNVDGLNHLKVVTMILHEVLRLYAPTVEVARELPKDMKIGGLSLPSGVQVGLPIMLLHYDEDVWGADVREFKPERFSEGVSKATKNQLVYLPFGWGPRTCIAQNFAMLELKLAVSMILQNFTFELSPSYVHAPCTLLNLQPQYGAHLIFHKL